MANEAQPALTPREQYLAEIKAHKTYLGTVIKESQTEYSKQLLSLSSAILALSFAFLKNLVTVKTAIWFCLLYTAWGLFAATIFFTLAAIRISIKAHKIYQDDIEKELAGQTDLRGKTWRDQGIPVLSWLTTLCFVGGVACLVVFAVTNVQRERAMSDQTYATPTLPSGITKDDQKDWVEVQRIKPVKTPPPPPPAQPPAEKPPQK
jgi:hypothetical protein